MGTTPTTSTTPTAWDPQTGEHRLAPATPVAAAGTAAPRVHSTWNATIRTMLGAALAVTLVLLAFAWPTHTSRAKDMPLGVVATAPQQAALAQQLRAHGDAFTLHAYPDRAAAVAAIEHRDAYGAIVLPAAPGQAPEVLTASAAGTAASQMITMAAQQMAAQQALTAAQQAARGATPAAAPVAPKVTDVVPLASTDARGAGLAVAGLPLAMGGMIGGVMISLLLVGWKRRLVAVAGYGVLGGLLLAAVLGPWFGFVPGSFGMLALVCGLAIAATASFIVGAQSLIGQPGIALGAVATMFVGNPISGQQLPAEWLPWHWGTIGQWFVPGAAGNLMRLEAYFPQAATGRFWLALVGWLLVGVVLTLIGRHKDDEVIHLDGYTEADAPRHAA